MDPFELVHLPEIFVVGISCKTTNENNQSSSDISKLMSRFHEENIKNNIMNRISDDTVVVYYDYEGDYTKPYTCLIGCHVPDLKIIPKELESIALSGTTYAVYHAKGEFPKNVVTGWQLIWNSNLKRTYAGDFQVHKKNNEDIKIYVAISD